MRKKKAINKISNLEARIEKLTDLKTCNAKERSIKKKRVITAKNTAFIAILISIITAILIIIFMNTKKQITVMSTDSELLRAMTYGEFTDEDSKTNSDFVRFGAFFLRDVNNDGVADKIKGTCREIGNEDLLYMELNVLTNGDFENGKITINSDNFYFLAAIPKDTEVKENAVGNNIKEIKLNTIGSGTQKLLIGAVRAGDYSSNSNYFAALDNNTEKYSKINSITLTGTHVAFDGTRTEVEKTVEFNVDWYATIKSEIPTYIAGNERNLNQSKDINQVIDEENERVNLEFILGIQEKNNKTILNSANITATVPQINGYSPIEVVVSNPNTDYSYDADTRKLTIKKSAVVNENGLVTSNCYDNTYYENRYNRFNVKIVYPLDAYTSSGMNTIELKLPIEAYYEGYNNPNEEFENPYKSNVSNATIVVSYSEPQGTVAIVRSWVGKYLYSPSYRYVVSKREPLKIYNDMGEYGNNTYIVTWYGSTGSDGESTGMTFKETQTGNKRVSDTFIKRDSSEENMENATSNIGIYFSSPSSLLGNDGWIKVYNDETDELIGEFSNSNWNNYSEFSPYRYEFPVKHVRVETSSTQKEGYIYIYNVKEIDSDYMAENYSREEFDDLQYIRTTLNGYLGENFINTATNTAFYEAPYSIAEINLNKTAISTQETEKDFNIEIDAEGDEAANQTKWINGEFLLKMPEEIIDINIKDVTIDNNNVLITGYETYEENGILFIKINTQNESEETYKINIICDIAPNPGITTANKPIELYAINENAVDYYYKTQDTYDVDGDGNITEQVSIRTRNINLVSPNSLLTSETASNFGQGEKIVIAPKIVDIDKTQRTATVNIALNNNYNGNISEVKILGRVPYEGNKYVINGNDLGSEFSVTMQDTGLIIPEALQGKVTVYYSENGEASKDLTDESNGWMTNPSDFSKVKSYLIDLGNYSLARGENHELSYDINIPEGLNYNEVSYSHHAVYFSLETPEGKFRTQTEPNKIGFMIAKQFDLELTKYQIGTDKVVYGAIYSVSELGKDIEKTKMTTLEGKLKIDALYVDRTYIIKERKTPEDYELNDDEIKFIVTEDDGKINVDLISGNPKSIVAIQAHDEEDYKVVVEVEDEIKGRLRLYKYEEDTNVPIRNAKFKITGKDLSSSGKYITTNANGEAYLKGLCAEENYVIEEVEAEGYYLAEPVTIMFVNNDGVYEATVLRGRYKEINTTIEEELPVINLSLEDEIIPRYNLEITKIKKKIDVVSTDPNDTTENTEEVTTLPGAVFELYKNGKRLGQYTSDENGKIYISNFYQYEEDRNIDQTYVLREIKPPEGYVNAKDTVFRVSMGDEGLVLHETVENGQVLKEFTVEGDTVKVVIPDNPRFKMIKKDAETGEVLAGVKFAVYEYKNDNWEIARNSKGDILGTKEIINDEEYYTVTTDSAGEVSLDLLEGQYKAVELLAPEKYDISNSEYYFSIGKDNSLESELQVNFGQAIGGSGSNDCMKAVVKTADGGYVVAGYYEQSMTLAGLQLTSKGSTDGVIIKYNKDNIIDWVDSFGGSGDEQALSVTQTADGGFAVVGYFNGTLYAGNETIISSGNKDGFLIKYNENGIVEWAKAIGGTDSDIINSVTATIDDGIAIVLQDSNSIIVDETTLSGGVIVLKYDIEGNVVSSKVVTENTDCGTYMYSISQNSNGEYVLGGYMGESTIKISDETFSNPSTEYTSGLVIKCNENFEPQWSKIVGGTTNNDFIYASTATSDGGAVVGLTFMSDSITIGEDVYYNNSANDENKYFAAMVIKYDKDGNVEWVKQLEKEYYKAYDWIYSVDEADNGDIIIGGTLQSAVLKIDNVELRNAYTSGCPTGFVLKLDKNGKAIYGKTLRSGNGTTNTYGVIGINDEIIEVGQYSGHLRTEIGRISTWYYSGNTYVGDSSQAGFVLRLSENIITDGYDVKLLDIYSAEENLGSSYTNSTELTSDGGMIVGGYFSNKMKIGEIELEGPSYKQSNSSYYYYSNDGFIIKYDESNNIVWARDISSLTNSNCSVQIKTVKELSDGKIIAIGSYYNCENQSNPTKFKIDNIEIESQGGTNGFIIKLRQSGEIEWVDNIDGNNNDYINSIIETDDEGLLAIGYFNSSEIYLGETKYTNGSNSSLCYLIKYNKNGEVEWSKVLNEFNCSNIYMDKLNNGNYIIVGNAYSSDEYLQIGNDLIKSGMIAIEIDEAGNYIWAKNIVENTEGNMYLNTLIKTSDNGFAIGGDIAGYEVKVGNNVIIKETDDYWPAGMIIKCNGNGEVEWYNWFSGTDNCEFITSLVETKDGILAGGYIQSEEVKIGDDVIYKDTLWQGAPDSILVKYDKNGNVLWADNVIEDGYDSIYSIDVTEDNEIVFGGVVDYPLKIGNKHRYVYSSSGFVAKLKKGYASSETQELIIENNLKKYKITTSVNKIDGVKGGSISGESLSTYEIVSFGDSSTKQIKITPDENYEIIDITINGEKYEFEPLEDGSYIMPQFYDVTEDKNIVVTFALKDNKITINKIDSVTREKLTDAEFKLDQIEERTEPVKEEIIGDVVNSSNSWNATANNLLQDGTLYSNGDYYFTKNSNGYLIPTNSKTYTGSSGVGDTTANSYIPIDLTNVEGTYYVYISYRQSTQSSYDYGYATITQNTTAPLYNNSTGRFLYTSGNYTYTYGSSSQNLTGGNKYYLHLGYRKDSSTDTGDDLIEIRNIILYKKNVADKFINNNGKWESNIQGTTGVQSWCYVPIDLTNYEGYYKLTVNAEVSSRSNYDYGFATVNETTSKTFYYTNNSTNRQFMYLSGEQPAKDYSIELEGGKLYYLHLGYYKSSYLSSGEDKLTINGIDISLSDAGLYHSTVQTNSSGQAITQIPFGKYNLTETKAPEGYELDETPRVIEFRSTDGAQHEFTVEDRKLGNLIVHHYIKGTEESLADDEISTRKQGETYTTAPKMDFADYELEKDETGDYIFPENKTGEYTYEDQIVTYYYVKKQIPLVVHHYIEGTLIPVPLADGENAEDVTSKGDEGKEYETTALTQEELDEKYELVEVPGNSTGVYTSPETEVIYYYRIKKFSVKTSVNLFEEINSLGQVQMVKGGSISGENEDAYETVEYKENSTKEIKAIPDYGFEVKSITVNDESIEYTVEQDGSVILNKFVQMLENKNVVVTFQRTQGTITVNHYLEGTEERITDLDGNTVNADIRSGSIGSGYATQERIDLLDKYELVSSPVETSGEYSEEVVELNYYYRLKKYPYVVNYLLKDDDDDDTNNTVLHEQKAGELAYDYGTIINAEDEKIEIEGYTYNSLNVENLIITGDNNIINVYYTVDATQTKTLSYTVEYYKDGVLQENDTQTETIEVHILDGDTLEVDQTKINAIDKYEGYEFQKSDPVRIPNIAVNGEKIKIYYVAKIGKVTINHIDQNDPTNILDTEAKEGKYGESLETSEKDFDGYILVEKPDVEEYTYGENEQIVNYYYAKVSTGVLEKHLDIITGNPVAESTSYEGYEGKPYTTNSKEIEDYKIATNKDYYEMIAKEDEEFLVNNDVNSVKEYLSKNNIEPEENYIPENKEGTMTEELIEVKYYYVPKVKLTVKYVDILTGEEIKEEVDGELVDSSIRKTGDIDEAYETEAKVFDKYLKVSNKSYYKLFLLTHPEALEEENVTTLEEYLEKKNIDPKAEYVPENKEGNMRIMLNDDGTYSNEIVVTYYYGPEREVTVKYYDKVTGEEISEEVVKVGPDGDPYDVSSEDKEVEGYTLIEEPTNPEGVYEETNEPRKFYYAKNTKVRVRYVDKETNTVIDSSENYNIEGYEGKAYSAEKKNFENYNFVEDSGNTEGTMRRDEIQVIYYYAKANVNLDNSNSSGEGQGNNLNQGGGSTEKTDQAETQNNGNNTSNNATPSTSDNNGKVSTNSSSNVSSSTSTTNNKVTTTSVLKPKTGDNIPVIVCGVIFAVIIANIGILRYFEHKKNRKKSRIEGK